MLTQPFNNGDMFRIPATLDPASVSHDLDQASEAGEFGTCPLAASDTNLALLALPHFQINNHPRRNHHH